ncbi:MAG: hypothetical protein ACK55I_39900, partial [bacterium]
GDERLLRARGRRRCIGGEARIDRLGDLREQALIRSLDLELRDVAALHATDRALQERQLHEAGVAVLRALRLDDRGDGDRDSRGCEAVADLQPAPLRERAADERSDAAGE